MTKEEDGTLKATTTGILFVGNEKALKEFPYNQIKYIRYFEDGSYKPYEYRGNLIEMTEKCFNQLKSEIEVKEFHFGLFGELRNNNEIEIVSEKEHNRRTYRRKEETR